MNTLSRINLKSADRDALLAVAEALRLTTAVNRIVLFGSKARGDDRADSDIDLLVLLDGPADSNIKDALRQKMFEIEMDRDVCISLLIRSADEWDYGILQAAFIHSEIEEQGVLL